MIGIPLKSDALTNLTLTLCVFASGLGFNLKCMADSGRRRKGGVGKKNSLFNIWEPRVVDTLQYCTVAVFEPLETTSKKEKNRV